MKKTMTETLKGILDKLDKKFRFIGVDSDGTVHAYQNGPSLDKGQFWRWPKCKGVISGEVEQVATIDATDFAWQTLIRRN